MENVVYLEHYRKHFVAIGDIPKRQSEQDDASLKRRCIPLFRRLNGHKVMILTRHGEIAFGFKKLEDVIGFYRTQGEIRSVHLIPDGVALDLMHSSQALCH